MSALRPAGSTRAWRRLRLVVLTRDSWRCQLPDDDRPDQLCLAFASHVDHVTPRAHGGTDDLANLRAACARHNLARGAATAASRPFARATKTSSRRGWSW